MKENITEEVLKAFVSPILAIEWETHSSDRNAGSTHMQSDCVLETILKKLTKYLIFVMKQQVD